MGIAQGYGRAAGSNGLVFAYDTGDTRNSYIGEPTANLINPASLGIYSWWTRAVQTLETLPNETYYGMPIYRLSLSLDTDEQRNYARDPWGAGTAWYAQYLTYQANTAYIASAIYRPVSHSDMTVKGHPSNIGGWGLTYNDSVELRNGWKRHRIDRNYGAVASDNKYYHLWAPSANTGDVLVIDITANQIEQKNHLTPFVNGTRSNTQGLLSIANNPTIDLTNVSFDNDAQFLFDGTNDTISVNSYSAIELVDNVSIEYVYMRLSTDPILDVIANKYHSTGWELFCQTGNTFALAGRNGDGTYYSTSNPAYTIQNNQYYHLVAIKEGVSWRLYVNGELYASLTAGSVGTWSNTGILQIGGEGNGYYPNMKLPVLKIYNRVLTQAEIANSYQHYKTRFNI
jgi:hypothetical protein